MRDDVVMMARVRNEERWIVRNLERTFQVAKTVVLWDDGSTDETYSAANHVFAREGYRVESFKELPGGVRRWTGHRAVGPIYPATKPEYQDCELHYITSPFRPAVNALEEVSEIRDKNVLWWYVKSQIKFKHVLCIDGDEMLSLAAIRHFDEAIGRLESGIDMMSIPFVYLWNDEAHRRVDGIYGNLPDGLPKLRFPRLFSIMRVDPYDLYEQRFAWMGHRQGRKVLGGFHCGSVPQENFIPKVTGPTFPYPIIHFGYLHNEDRQRKHVWYNTIDPGNVFEGEYAHIIEKPNQHAPGPTILEPFEDK